ncbi:MAG: F0F1 ATP synthase subunit epsilon [Dehalococcoidia bacterium]|nr:F0F1 ATP synthase subunit epsilon [Dehalococcoidia bacterium]
MSTMRFEIVTAERVVYTDEVNAIVAPGIEGELGILPHHAPLLTYLQPGEVRVIKEGQETSIAVTGGFLEVLANKVTILADAAERADEIDEARAQAAIQRAQERLQRRTADVGLERAMTSLRHAQVRLRVAQRRRRPGGGAPPPSGQS